ncbi:MAG: hypothetical protein II712_03025 [Erysipelotrichaceae bacterium]|nr:hypothetical protein [Erysipelotrichaceae bacterium]
MRRREIDIAREAFEKALVLKKKLDQIKAEERYRAENIMMASEYMENLDKATDIFRKKAGQRNAEGAYWAAKVLMYRCENEGMVYMKEIYRDLNIAQGKSFGPADELKDEFMDRYLPLADEVHKLKKEMVKEDGSPDIDGIAEAMHLEGYEIIRLIEFESLFHYDDDTFPFLLTDEDLPF